MNVFNGSAPGDASWLPGDGSVGDLQALIPGWDGGQCDNDVKYFMLYLWLPNRRVSC